MDTAILWRVALIQALSVLVLSLALGAVFSSDFFETWGWLTGPAAWLLCAYLTARVVGLPPAPVLVRAIIAGLITLLLVFLGQHWLGAIVAIGLFAVLCSYMPRPVAPATQQPAA